MLNKTKKQKVWKTIVLSSLMIGSIVYMAACNKNDASKVENSTSRVPASEMVDESLKSDVVTIAEVMPEFVGGDEALMNFLRSNVIYPNECKEKKLEGIVYVSFIINEEGEVVNAESIKYKGEPHILLVMEALRVINDMPNWIAGKNNGKAVSVRYNIPIRFILKKDKK